MNDIDVNDPNGQTYELTAAQIMRIVSLAENGANVDDAIRQVMQEKAGNPADTAQTEQDVADAQAYMRDHPGTPWRDAVKYARSGREQSLRYSGRNMTPHEREYLAMRGSR